VKALNFNPNPILVKELRSRMRGWRAFATLTAYLIFLALFSYGVYRIILSASPYTGGLPLSPFIGQALYAAIANLSLFFVVFLTPALTAAAISSEHEKLTLEMLQATPLAAHTILMGKLVSTAGYIFLLLFAAVPIVSLIFVFGGVVLTDLLLAALVIWTTAITFGMIGLFFSAWRKRTIQAIVLSYLVILIMIGGTYALYIFWGIVLQDFPPRFILVVNPFSALASVLSMGGYQAGVSGVFSFLAGLGPALITGDPTLFQQSRPLWHYTLAFDIGLSTVLYLLATRFIKPVRPWRRVDKRAVLILILIALLYIGLSVAVFHQDLVAFVSPLPVPPTMSHDHIFNAVPVPARGAPPIQPLVLPTTELLPPFESPTEETPDAP
jgi:ABC-type transport system involved in multi-copper enzyme maturation permease subunit